ncbi:MAG TPA: flagellar basal body protein [Ramlibacter sp.]|uniref:flagellar basal body rod protein FlgB n=1 Tax=Ramlibacter sp. TaxID=1917967 RepID=UPI002ED1F604
MPIEALTTSALSAALDAASRRHAVIAGNIANANSEGYVPLRLQFDERIEEARQSLREQQWLAPGAIDALRGSVGPIQDAAEAGTRTRLDAEMAELARNSVQFQALTQGLSRHLAMLALAAADGKR